MLRPATDADSPDVLRWRNHPEVRAVSLTQHEITEEEHAAYWAATRESDAREIYIYERHDVPSGVVTYFDIDREAGSAWWGYYLDNDGLKERGELLPAWIEIQRQAKRLAFDELGLTSPRGRGPRGERGRSPVQPSKWFRGDRALHPRHRRHPDTRAAGSSHEGLNDR